MKYTREEIEAAGLDDFRVFLIQVWAFLRLPPPTAVQLDIARYLQHGPRRRMVEAFRGVGKSWITVTYCLWRLFLDPELKIMMVSANQSLADANSIFARSLIEDMPLLQHLRPTMGQKDSTLLFEVGPASTSRDPSMKSAGITGQITGSRADLIVADDIEVPKNSYTQAMRERLSDLVKEFDDVLKPNGEVVYLGTPQTEHTLYNRLMARGYDLRVWTAEVPANPSLYKGRLAPFILKLCQKHPPRTPVEPKRFSREDLDERLLSHGKASYARQYMLDTNPADAERHPLKLHDLIITAVDREMAPAKIMWSNDREYWMPDLSAGGFDGDYFVRPFWRAPEMQKFQGACMWIDPSGTGKDETAYAIVKLMNAQLYLVACGGFKSGFAESTLNSLAAIAIRHRVSVVGIEKNYGGGMFDALFKPILSKASDAAKLKQKEVQKDDHTDPEAAPGIFAPRILTDEDYKQWASQQKELRILDTLEPLVQGHRLIVCRSVIEQDLAVQQENERYSFVYQFTRMERVKGALGNEDRLDAVAGACRYFIDRLDRDTDKLVAKHKQELLDTELKKFNTNVFSRLKSRLTIGAKPGYIKFSGRR